MITEPWYAKMEDLYGEEYCRRAGYFEETKPFEGRYYDVFDLPKGRGSMRPVILFSGAFHPFHAGHLEALKKAAGSIVGNLANVLAVIHIDHVEYRSSKGEWSQDVAAAAYAMASGHGFDVAIVSEDQMPNGCSRNFTRLYTELAQNNADVIFLAGGDRANYALTFRDQGQCIVAGRMSSPLYNRWKHLANDCIAFLPGDHPASSTDIRKLAAAGKLDILYPSA